MLSSGHAVPATLTRVSSRHHALVRDCRSLARADRNGRVLLDGAHLVLDALRAGATIEAVLATRAALDRDADLSSAIRAAAVPLYEGSAGILEAASPARSPSGVVAIARWLPADASRLFAPFPALVVGLVDVQDPGNVGAVIRVADALGATGVGVTERSADPGGWKALRGSMGSAFRLPVARLDLAALLAEAGRAKAQVAAAVARGGTEPALAWLSRPTLLLLGHEGAGLPDDVLRKADLRVTLPMRAGVDSLNVSVAAALVVDEARRQRASTVPR
jgi:RNA methyltransferase, TrmH family